MSNTDSNKNKSLKERYWNAFAKGTEIGAAIFTLPSLFFTSWFMTTFLATAPLWITVPAIILLMFFLIILTSFVLGGLFLLVKFATDKISDFFSKPDETALEKNFEASFDPTFGQINSSISNANHEKSQNPSETNENRSTSKQNVFSKVFEKIRFSFIKCFYVENPTVNHDRNIKLN